MENFDKIDIKKENSDCSIEYYFARALLLKLFDLKLININQFEELDKLNKKVYKYNNFDN